MSNNIACIILAAGESRRMGRPKLFLPINGSTLLRRAVEAALEIGPAIVVTGAYEAETRAHLGEDAGVQFVYNADWATGMAGSIAAGVRAAAAFAPAGYLILLADQPGIGADELREYVMVFGENPAAVVATWYPQQIGVPAIFPARLADELMSGEGQYGARELIAREGEAVEVIRFDLPPEDIDTPEDYQRITGATLSDDN